MDYLYKLLEEQEDKENIDYVTENKDVVKIIQKVYEEKGEGVYCIFYCQLKGKLGRYVFTRHEYVEILESKKYLECKNKVDNIPERDDINEVVYVNLGNNILIPYLYANRILNTIDSFGTCVFLLTESRALNHKSALDIYKDKSVAIGKCYDDQIIVYENVSLLIQTGPPLRIQEKENINNILSFLEPKNQLNAKIALNNYGEMVPNKVNYSQYMTLTKEQKEKVVELDCSLSFLHDLPKLPKELKRLICTDNYIEIYKNLPKTLIEFDCSGDYEVKEISKLPKRLEILKCSDCDQLTNLPKFPETLVELDCSNCQRLSKLPKLPEKLEILDVSGTVLSPFPKLPPNLKFLDCSKTRLRSVPKLPDTLIKLRCNKGTRLPKELPKGLKIEVMDEHDSTDSEDFEEDDSEYEYDSENEYENEHEKEALALYLEAKKKKV